MENDASSPWEIRPVLASSYTDPIPTLQVYVANIQDSKFTKKLITSLNSKFPDPKLQHLKRVNCIKTQASPPVLKLLLTTVSDNLIEKIQDYLYSQNLSQHLGSVEIIEVPDSKIKTRKQFKEAMKLWPLASFSEDKYIEKVLNNTLFGTLELKKLENFMSIAIRGAEKSVRLGGKGIGAVIVYKDEILAIGCDARNLHPLKHAVMAAIDMIAWVKQNDPAIPAPKWAGDDVIQCNSEVVRAPHAYLCTDYDVFVTREPCTMCSMALLHNRAKRIFFGCTNVNGALESVCKLHTLPDINHRYEVFGGVLAKECEQVLSNLSPDAIAHQCFR